MSADSNNKNAAAEVTDLASAAMAFWAQWMEQTSRGTQAMLEAVQSVGDPNQLQRKWAEVMSDTADNFMRTPAFLEMMRRNLKMVTDLKMMQDHLIEGSARHLGLPLAEDITGLFERLNVTEQKILERLSAIEGRLEAIEASNNGAAAKRASSAKRAAGD